MAISKAQFEAGSLSSCFKQGEWDPGLYGEYKRKLNEAEEIATTEAMLDHGLSLTRQFARGLSPFSPRSFSTSAPPKKLQRREPKGVAYYTNEEGKTSVLPPKMSSWYNMYVAHPQINSAKFHRRFRARFRMPYQSYEDLCDLVIEHVDEYFARWTPGKTDAVGNPCAPIELLVLTALRYLGRGWTFDDLSENTAISEEVIRLFFHQFIKFGAEVLFEKHVIEPRTASDLENHSHEYLVAGFPGAIGSMDATHISCERVSWKERQSHLSHKLPYTARSFNLTVNHRRRILSTTTGHPARWNDKTLITFDDFAMDLKEGKILGDHVFELYEKDGEDSVKKVTYRGAWLLVDNGYHSWAITIPPMKITTKRSQIRFSQWLESMRKDVECTFGILKGRWRILKTGIRIRGLEEVDRIWKTCCALHNWLLEVDGLDKSWNSGVPSEWQGDLGKHDDCDVRYIPRPIRRLLSPQQRRNYDTSGMGIGGDMMKEQNHEVVPNIVERVSHSNGEMVVRKMSMQQFRSKLVEHFDIAFKKRELSWPSRTGLIPRDI
ncbi:DDE superfamily endonuclease [Nitzschia inconspicua]|uniref:DDE superfamily endonuclease n=1 Tax=Nitzschia inconspicua TaxID=303405 RepID=A0A9K3PC36_9STRA|nr:DDE superfamily endonuclease [Nitzschia inconspicua]